MTHSSPKDQLKFDASQESGFVAFFQNLSEKPATTVRFFDRGDYYTVHGEDAIFVTKELFKTSAVMRYIGSNKLASATVSKLNFEAFIRILLLVKQYRVEVFKQKNSGKNDWEAMYKASPGNLVQFEDILFGGNNAPTGNGVIALKMSNESGKRIIGAAHVDVTAQTFVLSQFDEGDSFSNVESLIVQLGCKECIVPSGDSNPDMVKLKMVLSRNNLLVTERKKGEFSTTDASQDISRLVRYKSGSELLSTHLEMKCNNAVASLLAAIKYLELLSDEGNLKQFSLKSFDFGSFLRLDGAALKALHVEPSQDSQNRVFKERSLFGLLDKCQSAQGRRLLNQWLRQPLIDQNRIVERQNLIEALITNVELRHSLGEDHLKRIPDLSRLARKLGRKSATLQDCYRLYQCVERLPDLCEAFGKYDGDYVANIQSVFSSPLQEHYNDMAKFQEMLHTTLDMKLANEGDFIIKAEFDETLTELRDTMTDLETSIEKEFKKAANELSLEAGKTIKLETNAQIGYHFRVTLKEEKVLRNNRSFFVIDSTKAGVRFRNNSLQSLNIDHGKAKQAYLHQQKSIADEIINIAAGYTDVVHNIGGVLSILDCIYSLASVAVSAPVPYCKPEMLPLGSGIIELTECRHPMLERLDDVSYIPNNCFLNKENGLFHIITGPNMGGKSTFLRSVATTVLLGQIGSYVPCTKAKISIIDSIFTRVGAGDLMLKGVSTFMAEMLETSVILKTATKNSLIIIDELGRGTSTYDGFGLAWAISEHIAQEIGSFCLFATHFHELTALEKEMPVVKNYHVTATTLNRTLTLLYQIKKGPCDRSFGINVAELAHFPPETIEYAKRKARELEDDYWDEDDQSEEAFQRRKKEKLEGETIIDNYLAKAKNLETLSQEEFKKEIVKLRQEIKAINNPWIEHLLA